MYRVALVVEAVSMHSVNVLCREMGDEKVAYYSSIVQFDALCATLSEESQYPCEVALLHALNDIRIDVIAHMSVTAELTDMCCGAKKSAIMIHDGMFDLILRCCVCCHCHFLFIYYIVYFEVILYIY